MTESHKAPSRKILDATLALWQQTGKQTVIPVQGTSMLPLLKPADEVLIAPDYAKTERGCLLVFQQPERVVVHRLLRIDRTSEGQPRFITKGDNTLNVDPPVPPEAILGKVSHIRRKGKLIYINTPTWRAMGWLIASSSLLWATIYGLCRAAKQRWLGPQPNRITGGLRQGAYYIFSRLRTLLQQILMR